MEPHASRMLEQALEIAVAAHAGNADKDGRPSVLHTLRVVARLDEPAEMIAAALHEVVGRNGWSLERLAREGFPEEILTAVDILTRRPGESYAEHIARVRGNPLAIKVKVADLEDNLDLRRLARLTGMEMERLERRLRGWMELKS